MIYVRGKNILQREGIISNKETVDKVWNDYNLRFNYTTTIFLKPEKMLKK